MPELSPEIQTELTPVRGLVAMENSRRQRFAARDVQRWINLDRMMFKVEKIDLLMRHVDPDLLKAMAEYGRLNTNVNIRLSLRTDCADPPPRHDALKEARLIDVFLTPPAADSELFQQWLDVCREAGLPLRVQLRAPFDAALDVKAVAARLKKARVKSANIVLHDPFDGSSAETGKPDATIEKMNALAAAVAAEGVETNMYGLPLCLVEDRNAHLAGNSTRFFGDHQQYDRGAYELARKLYRRPLRTAALAMAVLLAGRTPLENPLDQWVVEWLLIRRRWWYSLLMLMHKVTLYSRLVKGPVQENAALVKSDSRQVRPDAVAEGPKCASCRLRRICDGVTPAVKRVLPGVQVRPREGQPVLAPEPATRCRYYDKIDETRLKRESARNEMAEEAVQFMNRQTSELVPSGSYRAVNTYSEIMSGAVRWHSATHGEKLSTGVAHVRPPFLLSCGIGGGVADLAGFAVGKHLRLVCPMLRASHELSLYVRKSGEYVLMRDGHPVAPTELKNPYFVPVLMPDWNEVCLSLWNIDGTITTQEVRIWKEPDAGSAPQPARFSVIIFSTRFSRRLQAALQSLAHQEGAAPGDIEVVVGYVPGIDATDDVLESCRLAYPKLRIRRAAFPESRANSKGFVINESIRQATGEWVILLDADILLPPDFFKRVGEETDGCVFMAPDGRVMLDSETTAKVLLGEIEPWRQWRALINGGEYRHREAEGIPIGFCQIVHKSCFEQVQYEEYEHFAVADSNFGLAMRKQFGQEKRLGGMPVIHLDHGGSRWFGTRGHL